MTLLPDMNETMNSSGNVPSPPRDLAALIRMAVQDARKLDRLQYEPDAANWHLPGKPCLVCFGGAVMVGTFGICSESEFHPHLASKDWDIALYALEYVRSANWMELAANGWLTDAEADAMADMHESESSGFQSWKAFDEFLDWAEAASYRIDAMRSTR